MSSEERNGCRHKVIPESLKKARKSSNSQEKKAIIQTIQAQKHLHYVVAWKLPACGCKCCSSTGLFKNPFFVHLMPWTKPSFTDFTISGMLGRLEKSSILFLRILYWCRVCSNKFSNICQTEAFEQSKSYNTWFQSSLFGFGLKRKLFSKSFA